MPISKKTYLLIGFVCIFYASNSQNTFNNFALKLDLPALSQGTFSVAFERDFKKNKTYEIGIGIFTNALPQLEGITSNDGFFVRTGIKYLTSRGSINNTNNLSGFYIRQDVFLQKKLVSIYGPIYNYTPTIGSKGIDNLKETRRYLGAGFMINFGWQNVFFNGLIVDAFGGYGFAFNHISKQSELLGYDYEFKTEYNTTTGVKFDMDIFSIAAQAGLKIGYVGKTK